MKKSPQNNSISNMDNLIQNNPAVRNFKRKAKTLQKKLKEMYPDNPQMALRKCQDLVVQQHGYKHWHEFTTTIKNLYVAKHTTDVFQYEALNKIPSFVSKLKPINLGYSKTLGMNAWLDKDFLNNHIYLKGDTGVRESLELHLVKQLISDGHPVIYMDGEGNTDQLAKIKQHAIANGREKDIKTLSFGENTSNYLETNWYFPKNLPFSFHSFTELIISLMDDMEDTMWKTRAISLISVVMMILTYLRDKDEIILDWEIIREYLILDVLIKIHKPGNSHRIDLPKHTHAALRAYLFSIPGYDDSAVKQNDSVIEQHGYLQMVFTKIIGQLGEIVPSKRGFQEGSAATVVEARERIHELFNGNQIFILSFPNGSQGSVAWGLMSQFFLEVFKISIIDKLVDKQYGRREVWHKPDPRFVFIKSCTLPKYFSTIPTDLHVLNMGLVLSYKDEPYISSDEGKALIANTNAKIIAEEGHYQLILGDLKENLVI